MRVEKEDLSKRLEQSQSYLDEIQKLVQIQKTKNQRLVQLSQSKMVQLEQSLVQINLKDQFEFMDQLQLLQKDNESLRRVIDEYQQIDQVCQVCHNRLDQVQIDPIDKIVRENDQSIAKSFDQFHRHLETILFEKFPDQFINQKIDPDEQIDSEQLVCIKCNKEIGSIPRQSCPKCSNLFHQKCYPKKGDTCYLCK